MLWMTFIILWLVNRCQGDYITTAIVIISMFIIKVVLEESTCYSIQKTFLRPGCGCG